MMFYSCGGTKKAPAKQQKQQTATGNQDEHMEGIMRSRRQTQGTDQSLKKSDNRNTKRLFQSDMKKIEKRRAKKIEKRMAANGRKAKRQAHNKAWSGTSQEGGGGVYKVGKATEYNKPSDFQQGGGGTYKEGKSKPKLKSSDYQQGGGGTYKEGKSKKKSR